MNDVLISKLCQLMDTVILEKISENAFTLVSGHVEWLNRICRPSEMSSWKLYPVKEFTFISNFIEEVNSFWASNRSGSIKSGLWIETDAEGNEYFFEASAINLLERHFLVIQKDSYGFTEKQQLIQHGRNLALDYQALERLGKQVHADKEILETRVRKRTEELKQANERLKRELFERKQFEKERTEMIMQFQEAKRMEAIGTIAGGIAHDFNNILSALIGFTEISLKKVSGDSTIENNLNQVLKAALRAKELVRQILTFSHQAKEEGRPTQIKTIVVEVIKMLRASLPANIEIKSELSSEAYILADPTRIHQVIMNLCTNAVHAMEKEGGTIQICLENFLTNQETPKPYPYLTSGKYVGLYVMDSGHGMTNEVKDRIFEPFFTTKEDGKGTGMGLSVVHSIVKNYKGTIHVESSSGSGSIFRVFFPIIQMEEHVEKLKEEEIKGGSEKIFIVDDETIQTELMREMLEEFGYTVVTHNDSVEALNLFLNDIRFFNLVIADMTMPKMTGKTLAEEILKNRPDMPIILCSGYSEEITADEAKGIGIREYLMKPIGLKDLAKAVRRVLDG
ncbi:MAG: response regulator [Thermodesulfobacteriota bacterium]|nr:response regulator [Thermodesulfobacteriota bacterium]